MSETKIILVSDSHGGRKVLEYIKDTYSDYDYLIHLGDSEISPSQMGGFLFVRGNHDTFYDDSVPYQRILEAGGHRIYICHGHKDFMQYFKYASMLENAKKQGCDTIFFGHVHVYQDTVQNDIRLLNPGSIWHNRDGTVPSFMKVIIDDQGIISAERIDYVDPSRKRNWIDRLLDKLISKL